MSFLASPEKKGGPSKISEVLERLESLSTFVEKLADFIGLPADYEVGDKARPCADSEVVGNEVVASEVVGNEMVGNEVVGDGTAYADKSVGIEVVCADKAVAMDVDIVPQKVDVSTQVSVETFPLPRVNVLNATPLNSQEANLSDIPQAPLVQPGFPASQEDSIPPPGETPQPLTVGSLIGECSELPPADFTMSKDPSSPSSMASFNPPSSPEEQSRDLPPVQSDFLESFVGPDSPSSEILPAGQEIDSDILPPGEDMDLPENQGSPANDAPLSPSPSRGKLRVPRFSPPRTRSRSRSPTHEGARSTTPLGTKRKAGDDVGMGEDIKRRKV